MAVVNTKSNRVSLAEATPIKPQPSILNGGVVRSIVATVEIASGDDDGSVFRMCRVHSSWCIRSIKRFNDAITGGTDYDIGLYETAEHGGAEVDKDVYVDGQSLATASAVPVESMFHTRDIAKVEQRVWQDAGKTADPKRFYDLCATGNTVGTASGTLTVIVEYVAEA